MPKDNISFVAELFRNMNIHTHFATNPHLGISTDIDMGLRSLLFGAEDYLDILDNSMNEARPNTLYRFFDEYNCNYIFMALPGKNEGSYFFIGPYLLQSMNRETLKENFRDFSLSEEMLEELCRYYASLPVVEDENLIFTVASTLGQSLWGSKDNFTAEYVEYAIPDMRRPIPVVPYQRDIRENKVSLALLEQNYENEKELMEAVSQGKLHKVNVMASMFFNNGTEARVPDSLRNRKNYLIILKTLLRKAAEQGGVHPFYLHKSSSYYADKIEALHSIKESVNLQEEMIRNFCLLVKYNSLSTYSYIVGRAITIIAYDLQADLSLAGIAAQLNVSPAYLSGLFKKECGCTLTEYVNKKRVEYAIGLLHNTEKQVQTVAYESGFQDPNYFIRVFRKHTGMTPNQYRKTK